MIRLFVLLVSYFLCIVALLYTIGSIVNIQVTSFFCPIYTKEEVHQHNYENENAQGDSIFSCWYINRQRLNYQAIFSLNSDIFTATIDQENLSTGQIITAVLYSIVGLVLLTTTLYYTYLWLYDVAVAILSLIKHTEYNPRVKTALVKDRLKALSRGKKQQSKSMKKTFFAIWYNLKKWYKTFYDKEIYPYFYVDSKFQILSIIVREWIEILIQIYALLLYGGVDVFSTNSNILSQEAHIIVSFTTILSLNCLCGMYN